MSWGWWVAVDIWLFGVSALWDECYDLAARITHDVRTLWGLRR